MSVSMRILTMILGSVWFFPVSCTGSLYAGTRFAAALDAREVARGDEVHRSFSIVLQPGENGQPFRAVRLAEWQKLLKDAGSVATTASPLMPSPAGSIPNAKQGHIAYRILDDQRSVQIIEVEDKDDDHIVWSRYRASADRIEPLASRSFAPEHMVQALPGALAVALGLYGVGLWRRRRARPAAE